MLHIVCVKFLSSTVVPNAVVKVLIHKLCKFFSSGSLVMNFRFSETGF